MKDKYPTVALMDWLQANRPDLFEAFWSEHDGKPQPHRAMNEATGLDIGREIDADDACVMWLQALKEQAVPA
jgi:hypothetical protein